MHFTKRIYYGNLSSMMKNTPRERHSAPRSEMPSEQLKPAPEGMRRYRVINLVTPTISSERALEVVNGIISKNEILKQNFSIEQLSYKVKKHSQGHQIVTDIVCEPDKIMPMRRKMEFNNSIMRTLVINHSRKKHNKFLTREIIGEDLRRIMSQFTTKRGRILFSKSKNPNEKKSISEAIKMLRFISFLPYCKYDS